MAATSTTHLVDSMRDAATTFVAALEESQRVELGARLDDPGYRQWSYLPGPRDGLPLAAMSPEQRHLALALLDTGCSAGGAQTARAVIELDFIRRELGGGSPQPGDDRFWFRVFGSPGEQAWAWRVNGHHLAVQVAVVGDELAVTPSFFGTEPATVPSGPHEGLRVLTTEEDLARELLTTLDEDQRRLAVTSVTAPADILTRHDPVADPSVVAGGIGHGDLDGAQQGLLQRLVRHYFGRVAEPAAEASWADAQEAGLDEIRFAWAGGARPGEGHYYSLLGPTFLVEYDNTQDGANHIHSVWRDLRHDWGDDLLAQHYAARRHRD
jgi:Protein of unknown function (DUF3500)